MTKEEIKALIANKIANQGNQVDLGGALATILNELVDGMGGGEGGDSYIRIDPEENEIMNDDKASFAAALNITEEQVDMIFNLSVPFMYSNGEGLALSLLKCYKGDDGYTRVVYMAWGGYLFDGEPDYTPSYICEFQKQDVDPVYAFKGYTY